MNQKSGRSNPSNNNMLKKISANLHALCLKCPRIAILFRHNKNTMKRLGTFVIIALCCVQGIWAQIEIKEPYKKLSEHTDDINKLVYSMPLRLFASASFDKSVRIYNEQGIEQKFYADEHKASVEALCFSKDGKYLYSGSSDWMIVQYDVTAGKVTKTLGGFNLPVKALACDATGKFLFASLDEDSIKIFDLSLGGQQKRGIPTPGRVTHIISSYDGKGLLVATQKPEVLQVDIKGNTLLTFAGHTDQVNQIAIAPNGKYIATASNDKTVILWDPKTATKIRTFTGHELKVNGVSFSADGKYITTSSNDKTVRVWDVESGKQIYTIKAPNSVKSAFITIDKKFVITGGKGLSKEKNYGIYMWSIGLDTFDKPASGGKGKPTDKSKIVGENVAPKILDKGDTTVTKDVAIDTAKKTATIKPKTVRPATPTVTNNKSNPKPKPNVTNSTTPGSTVDTDSAKVTMSVDTARIQQMPVQVGDSTLKNISNEKKSRFKKLK